jgi:hypothetical protein
MNIFDNPKDFQQSKIDVGDEDDFDYPESLILTVDEWRQSLMNGEFNEYDGSAYWVKDGIESEMSAFHTKQEDATHVAFYGA